MKHSTIDEEVAREKRNARRRASRKKPPLEDAAQMDFIVWARTNAELVWHTPNARKYSRASWEYWKRMGVLSGIPDVLAIFHGVHFALEFKRPGENPTATQRTILKIFKSSGWNTAVVESAEQAKKFVRERAPVWDENI